jgi:pilus assembly protein Flp/PilA
VGLTDLDAARPPQARIQFVRSFEHKRQSKLRSNQMIKRFFRDETGLELSEYAVAAALVALAAVAAFQLLGTNIGTKINELAGKIK